MVDENNYPESHEITKIIDWDYHNGFISLMEFVGSIWAYPDFGYRRDGNKFELHTGGWSGNEEIIEALEQNYMFWGLCWVESRRGGHYKFEIKESVQ